jgi:hypothetical protein
MDTPIYDGVVVDLDCNPLAFKRAPWSLEEAMLRLKFEDPDPDPFAEYEGLLEG